MRSRWMPAALLVIGVTGWMVTTALEAQVRGRDANITMVDSCAENDPAYGPFGGCPEGAPFPGANSYTGDVTVAEFFAFLSSPLAPAGQVIGHPSWRNEPSYLSIREGQTVRVTNRGGRVHSFTKVDDYGGGFVPVLNGTLVPAPECGDPTRLVLLRYNGSQQVTGLEPGVHKFQCCIHPWMHAAVRVD